MRARPSAALKSTRVGAGPTLASSRRIDSGSKSVVWEVYHLLDSLAAYEQT
jgi:hypothetical protein